MNPTDCINEIFLSNWMQFFAGISMGVGTTLAIEGYNWVAVFAFVWGLIFLRVSPNPGEALEELCGLLSTQETHDTE